MQLSQQSEERVSMMVDQYLFEMGISEQYEDNFNFENASKASDESKADYWQQQQESSAEEYGEEALSWAADENEFNWEEMLVWNNEDQSSNLLSPPQPDFLKPPSQFAVSEEIAPNPSHCESQSAKIGRAHV